MKEFSIAEETPLPLKAQDALDRGLDTAAEDDTPEEEYEACYPDGSLQNECWKVD